MKHSPAVGASSAWLERDTHYQLPAAIRDALRDKLGLQGEHLDATTAAVCDHLVECFGAGIRVYIPEKAAPRPTREHILAMWTGNNVKEVCAALGVHRTTVYRALGRYPRTNDQRQPIVGRPVGPTGHELHGTLTRPAGTATDDPDLD